MEFSEALIGWYTKEKRKLPWRETLDPFKIWLSEIILQQTRVNQGMAYYERFVEEFDTVFDLAEAPEERIIKLWQGLGYYSRARNLHAAAKQVVSDFGGDFPSDFKTLKKLKGVGDYTAAAIASFCFKEVVPVVDGNVYRVLSRIYGIKEPINTPKSKKIFTELAFGLISKDQPDTFNQAIMEFGALHCKPKKPLCNTCVFQAKCLAYQQNEVALLPTKKAKKKSIDRFFNYLILENQDHIMIRQRLDKDIWAGLSEFVLIETTNASTPDEIINKGMLEYTFLQNNDLEIGVVSVEKKHVLSHQNIYATFVHAKIIGNQGVLMSGYHWVEKKKLASFPWPRLIDKYMEKTNWYFDEKA